MLQELLNKISIFTPKITGSLFIFIAFWVGGNPTEISFKTWQEVRDRQKCLKLDGENNQDGSPYPWLHNNAGHTGYKRIGPCSGLGTYGLCPRLCP